MVVFYRSDLNDNCKNVSIEEIGVGCYPNSLEDIYRANIVLFVDGERTKILKNRYGFEGVTNTVEEDWR